MKKSREVIIFNIFAYAVVIIFSILCILPFLYTLSGSFTEESMLYKGITLIPKQFSIESYKLILQKPDEMLNAYGVTIKLVILGTVFGLLITTMTAFVLQRKDFKYRNIFSFYFFFTTLFSGGLVPSYVLISKMGMKNTFWVLLIPVLVNVFNIIITRTYFQNNIPDSLTESAKIDGANDFRIYAQIFLPVSKPILATIGLFIAIQYWNDWSMAMLYITDKKLYPLQFYLYNIFNSMQWKQLLSEKVGGSVGQMPQEGYKMAMTVFTMGPVILFYPFVQKYFVQGITIGAVKG
ncbi:MAG: carbohydrate ABC transporter permease [Oscillospiraceae bacterium]